jgi:hypothetical protein
MQNPYAVQLLCWQLPMFRHACLSALPDKRQASKTGLKSSLAHTVRIDIGHAQRVRFASPAQPKRSRSAEAIGITPLALRFIHGAVSAFEQMFGRF